MQTKNQIARREFVTPLPESFTDDTFDGVARDGKRRHTLGDHQAQACVFGLPGLCSPGCRNDKQRPPGQMPAFEGGGELGGAMQTGRRRK